MFGQTPGRGMGAFAMVEMSETHNTVLTLGQKPAVSGGQRKLVYPVKLHGYHMAMEQHTEDAEADVDALVEAIQDRLHSDPTMGGICYQAGMNSAGIRTVIYPAELWKEITLTAFVFEFDAEVQIIVS